MFGFFRLSVPQLRPLLRRIDWRPLLITAWGLVLLYPIRDTGWLSDDIYNASLPGLWIHNRVSPLDNATHELVGWVRGAARINPGIHLWKNLTFWLFPNLYGYKWAQIAAALASLLVFYGCLRGMGADADLAGLSCLLTAGLIQFRLSADPVLAFNGLMPLLLALTALSALLLHHHRTRGGWLTLGGSVLLYAAVALTYEMTYAFWVLHAWVLFRTRGWKRGALTLLPFVAVPVLLTLGSLYLRSGITFPSGSYGVGFSVSGAADTFAKQFVAALPCSNAGLDSTIPMQGVFSWETLRQYGAASLVALLVYGGLAYRLIRRAREGRLGLGWWAALGLLLAVLPIPVLCFCEKYQGAFAYGFGYLPVYIQYFGVALLLSAAVAAVGARLRRAPAALLALAPALLFTACTVLDYAANVRVVAADRVPFLFPRCEVEEAAESGLLHMVAPEDILVIDRLFPWELYGGDLFFYCRHTQTRLKGVLALPDNADARRRLLPDRPGDPPLKDAVRVRYVNTAQPGGFAVAGRLSCARLGPDGRLAESGLRGMRLAVWRGDNPDQPFIFHTCCWHPGGDPHRVDPVDLPSEALRRVRTTEHWNIYEVDTSYPYLDGEAAWLEFPPAASGGRPSS